MSVRRRTFPEVLDSLLTSLVGGVASESHPFPPPGPATVPVAHALEHPPAADVVSVHGSRNGDTHEFRKGVDYALSADGTQLEWTTAAELPDDGTLISVSYASAPARSALDDLSAGSVVRTLAESTALEIARLYAQLDAVYKAGFVDTATGDSLDHVVGLLGVDRVRGGRATGEIEFSRVAGGRGEITIPAGTRVMTADGKVEYATTAAVTLVDRQGVVRVTARDVEPNDPVGADALTVLPVPIEGIAAVTNPSPTARAALDETDDELRRRAKSFLGGSERATLGALRGAIARQQINAEIEESAETPGLVLVTPHVEALPPELEQRLLAAIEQSRPAGVQVQLLAPLAPRKVDLDLRLTTAPNLLETDLLAAHEAVRDGIRDYFARLPAKEPASINKLVGIALAVAGVEDLRVVSATVGDIDVLDLSRAELAIGGDATVLGELRLADPALPTLLSATVTPDPQQPPPDPEAMRAALGPVLATANAANQAEGAAVAVTYAALRAVLPAGHGVSFAFSQRSGFTRLLEAPADEPYALVPLERLSLNAVTVDG
jgi:hypothetical protein